MHQIRGRVGRSHHRAYAYLIVPHQRSMTVEAGKRLQAIESLEELGVGFTLATHDLEIRGAGEILGDEQSGQITEIGFTLYSELLDRAVQSLKSNLPIEFDAPLMRASEVDFHIPALIPETYIADIHNRLIEYKRISAAKSDQALRELQVELIDRFGILPEPLKHLLRITHIKLLTLELGIEKIDMGEQNGKIVFNPSPNIEPMKVIRLIQSDPENYRFDGKQTLRIVCQSDELEQRFQANRIAARGIFNALIMKYTNYLLGLILAVSIQAHAATEDEIRFYDVEVVIFKNNPGPRDQEYILPNSSPRIDGDFLDLSSSASIEAAREKIL